MAKSQVIDHTTKIEVAAETAVKVIAQAAEEASKVIANAAAEAVKVSNIKNDSDHDLLIELKTKMDGLKEDIKGLRDGTSSQLSDHETRINSLEKSKTSQSVLMSIGIGILTLLVSILIYHLIGKA